MRNRLHLLGDQVLADAVERRQIAASTARQILQLPDEERVRFRDRVAAGERIQTNDLAAARARLRAAGVPHPRRSRATCFAPGATCSHNRAITGGPAAAPVPDLATRPAAMPVELPVAAASSGEHGLPEHVESAANPSPRCPAMAWRDWWPAPICARWRSCGSWRAPRGGTGGIDRAGAADGDAPAG